MRVRGFTLVEVLVALVIVAIGMSALLASLTSAADTTGYLREKSFAEWVAMNRIAELRLQIQSVSPGKSSGEAELAGRRWRWEQEVTKLEVPGVNRIDVRVRPADARGGDKAAWLVTVSGIRGDAVAPPQGAVLPWWQGPQPGGGGGGAGGGSTEEDGSGRGKPRPSPGSTVVPDTLEPQPQPPPPNT